MGLDDHFLPEAVILSVTIGNRTHLLWIYRCYCYGISFRHKKFHFKALSATLNIHDYTHITG